MQEQSFEQMINETFKDIAPGDIVTGTVISVYSDYATLNIGYKHDGVLKRSDFINDPNVDLKKVFNVGDTLDVKVIKLNDGEGQAVLSRREIVKNEVNSKLQKLYESGGIKKGKVINVNDGGLIIEIEPLVNVFMPKSLISNKIENDLKKYLGTELEFYITEYKPLKGRCIADRKKIVVEEEKAKKEKALSSIKVSQVVEGIVQSIQDYGVFVDIGGISGLLHISEIGWGKLQNPKKIFKVGDKIKVLIREIVDDKISLTAKFPDENPWVLAKTQFAVGNVVKGKVARLTDYGAFISLNDNIDGLLHISEISWDKIKKVSDVLNIGDVIDVKIIDFDEKNQRISLSIKQLTKKPEEKEIQDIVDVDIEEYSKKLDEDNNLV